MTPIYCPVHSRKVLAKRDGERIVLWCKECRTEHVIDLTKHKGESR